MSNYFFNDIDKFQIISPKINYIYQIVDLIKSNCFYEAYNELTDRQISLYDVISITQRLKIEKFIKFADFVIEQKGNK